MQEHSRNQNAALSKLAGVAKISGFGRSSGHEIFLSRRSGHNVQTMGLFTLLAIAQLAGIESLNVNSRDEGNR
jgi:hypothetical protein